MSYKADLYIMLPCSIKKDKLPCNIQEGKNNLQENKHGDSELYIEALSKVSQVEFESDLSTGIERSFLGKIKLSCYKDERRKFKFSGHQDAFIIESQYKDTDFCLLTIAMVNVKVNLITYLLDQVSRGDLKISEEKNDKPLKDWIYKSGLEPTGKAFFALYMSGFPNVDEVSFILSAEAFYHEKDYLIVSDTIKKCINKNHAQYSYYDAYMSERGIINVTKEIKKSYKKRLSTECKMIFIMELVILKITAINIANKNVIEAYTNKDVSSKEILEILEGFAKSLPMWDIQHFKYLIAQEFTNRVESSFKVSRYLADYEKNRTQLEQIINTRKLIDSERKTIVITIFGIILTTIQTAAIFDSEYLNTLNNWIKLLKQFISPTIFIVMIAAVIAVCFWVVRKIKMKVKQLCKILQKTILVTKSTKQQNKI